jgi:hypothetical protein
MCKNLNISLSSESSENTEVTGNLSRHCNIDRTTRIPHTSTFTLRKHRGEKELSFYLLEYFENKCEREKVVLVKEFMSQKNNFQFGDKSAFIVINTDKIKELITTHLTDEDGDSYCNISFKQSNLPHCSCFYDGDEMTCAKLLSEGIHAIYLVSEL